SLERFYIVPNSEERRERLTAFYKDQLAKLEQLPFEKMSEGGKVDYILMKRELNEELFQLNKEQTERSQIARLVAAGDPIYLIEKQRRRGEFLKSELVAKQLNDMFRAIQAASKKLASEPNLSRDLAARAEGTIKGQQVALKSVYDFYYGYDPDFTWWVAKPYRQLDSVMNK